MKSRPNLNKHKTSWILQLQKENLNPIIQLVVELTNLKELKKWEIDYIKEHKTEYKLVN